MYAPERRGIVELASDAVTQATGLVQTEFKLARAEINENLVALKEGMIFMIIGAIFLVAALFLVLQTLVAFLIAEGMSPPLAVLIVAGGSALVGGVLMQISKTRLAHFDATPHKTLHQLQRDGQLAKEQLP